MTSPFRSRNLPIGTKASADAGFGKIVPERDSIGHAMNKVSNAKELGALVRQRRKQAGLTLRDAAGMAGVGSVSFQSLNVGNLLFSSDCQSKSFSYSDSNFMSALAGNAHERTAERLLCACRKLRATS